MKKPSLLRRLFKYLWVYDLKYFALCFRRVDVYFYTAVRLASFCDPVAKFPEQGEFGRFFHLTRFELKAPTVVGLVAQEAGVE